MNENLHSYKALAHQHQGEVDQELGKVADGPVHVQFIPHLAPITRGIHTTISLRLAGDTDMAAIRTCWQQAYAQAPFVRLRDHCQQVEVANVNGSNFCDFAGIVEDRTLVVCSAVDNLIKGASGQAVQNLNIMYGRAETDGLLGRIF